jgi:hypothetical protein
MTKYINRRSNLRLSNSRAEDGIFALTQNGIAKTAKRDQRSPQQVGTIDGAAIVAQQRKPVTCDNARELAGSDTEKKRFSLRCH